MFLTKLLKGLSRDLPRLHAINVCIAHKLPRTNTNQTGETPMKESLKSSEESAQGTARTDVEHADETRPPSSPSSPPGLSPPHIPEHALDPVTQWLDSAQRRHQPQHRNGPPVRPRHLARLVPQGKEKTLARPRRHPRPFHRSQGTVPAPATVRRYVSSLCALHRAAGWKNPLDHVTVRMALQAHVPPQGKKTNPGPRPHLADPGEAHWLA